MRLKTLSIILITLLVAAFIALNWPLLATPARFSFFFWSVNLSMGLIIVGLLLAVLLSLGIQVSVWQRRTLVQFRKQARDLLSQRTLAEDAEASRLTTLSTLIRSELVDLRQGLEQSIETLRVEIREAENSLAATLAEMDDRMRGTPVTIVGRPIDT